MRKSILSMCMYFKPTESSQLEKIKGEALRLLRTNSSENTFFKENIGPFKQSYPADILSEKILL